MKLVLVGIFLGLCLPSVSAQGFGLERFPTGANILFNLHTSLQSYFDRLKENTTFYENGLGCDVYGDRFRVCALSKLNEDHTKLTNRVFILGDDQIHLTFIVIHEGENLRKTPLSELSAFQFRMRGQKLTYECQGLSDIRVTWEKFNGGEKAVFFYPPINYIIESMAVYKRELSRKKYSSSCVFCSGPDWIEVRSRKVEGMPRDTQFYSSDEPDAITPRSFDSTLANQFYRPLSSLAASLPRALVFQAQFPDLKF